MDTVSVVSRGGVVLWQRTKHETGRRELVNALIQEVLLEDRAGSSEYVVGSHKLRWVLENEAQLLVVAIYPKFNAVPLIGELLRDVASTFARQFSGATTGARVFTTDFAFDEAYDLLYRNFDARQREMEGVLQEVPSVDPLARKAEVPTATVTDVALGGAASAGESDKAQSPLATSRSGNVLITKDGRRIATRGKVNQGRPAAPTDPASGKKKKPVKVPTKWDAVSDDPAVLEQASSAAPTAEELSAQTELQRSTYIKRLANGAAAPVRERVWENQPRGRLANWLRSYVGARELDEQDLARVIPGLREKLISKNVAVVVAEHVCESVQTSLAGKKLGTFESLHTTVESAMVSALQRILQPKREVNILRDVASAKALMRPYSIVLCGVNGVGKSTSLAKIVYWLQQNDNSVLIAAGDTFRHGAVEQLEVHGRCLNTPVFQMGYGADPSAVAAAAIAQASRQHTNVVMIDTAGRMQDHTSRMRALAKLIHDNKPDLILFVGEALVGNNGVDQLRKFNQCLVDYAPVGGSPRGIDGIVLTKFDTIDDKVGAALSMVYELGQPIVFVGVGQTYQDLKVIEPDVVVSALMQ